jgi:hypothetical protein
MISEGELLNLMEFLKKSTAVTELNLSRMSYLVGVLLVAG